MTPKGVSSQQEEKVNSEGGVETHLPSPAILHVLRRACKDALHILLGLDLTRTVTWRTLVIWSTPDYS